MTASPETAAPSNDIRPVVTTGNASNIGMWAFGVLILLGGIWIFSAMSANRAELQSPATSIAAQQQGQQQRAQSGQRITAPPALAIPQSLLSASELEDRPVRLQRLPTPPNPRLGQGPAPIPFAVTPPQQSFSPPMAPQPLTEVPPTQPSARPGVVFDSAFQSSPPIPTAEQAAIASRERVKAERFVRPSQTIPQGTVIPAVLETALDSTRPGAARALVQRDIYSFDGTRILIQRGSRIYGEYKSGLLAGQKRALIQWTRLVRPDGVNIALDSPSSDPLGRAGVKGKVSSNFFERFGGAILQSALDIGVGVATQKASSNDNVVLALPGSTQNLTLQNNNGVQRSLKVRHGTSVSVFVARDLDFSTIDS